MEGLKAICLTVAEGKALAKALEAEGAHVHYHGDVPDYDLILHILKNGGAVHVLGEAPPKAAKSHG